MIEARALEFVLAREGGKVDDPDDRGGRTAYGITQRVYDHYRRGLDLETADVWGITQEEVAAIYGAQYWDAIDGDRLQAASPRLALATFDCAVNSGPHRALKQLQTALGVTADGRFGPISCRALAAAEGRYGEVLAAMLVARDAFYRGIVSRNPSQVKFLKGWLNRTNHLRRETGVAEVPHGL